MLGDAVQGLIVVASELAQAVAGVHAAFRSAPEPAHHLHPWRGEPLLPAESTEITYTRLVDAHGPRNYARHVIPGYGHIDCIFGKNAVRDVYPLILAALDATA